MGKRSRRKQRAAKGASPSRKDIRKLAQVVQQAAQEFLDRATNPAIPAEEIASQFVATFGDRLPPDGFTMLVANKGSLERARAVADLALDSSGGCLGALVFAAEVAELEHDDRRCVELYEQAMDLSDEPVLKWCYALALHECGRFADAIEVSEQMSRNDPEDWSAHDAYRDVLVEIPQRIEEVGPKQLYVRLAGQAPNRSWSDTRCVTHDASFMSASLGTAASSPSRILLAHPITRSAVSFTSSVAPSDQRATYLCEP